MVSLSGRACLADFGLASIRDSNIRDFTSASNVKTVGTLRWQAPELLDIDLPEDQDADSPELLSADSPDAERFGVNTRASDVWAFACVCYEVLAPTHR